MNASKKELPGLTGLRVLAAYLVFFHHYPLPADRIGSFLHNTMVEGHIGVTIFYVLSGFLIAYNYNDSAVLTRPWLVNYARNRFARIYPVYFLLCIWTLLAMPAPQSAFTWISNITLTKGFFALHKFDGISQAWSLAVEESFYFLAPLFFVFFRARSILWAVPVSYGIGLVLFGIGQALNWRGLFGDWNFMVSYTFFGRAFEFWLGAALARSVHKGVKLPGKFHTYLGLLGVFGSAFVISLFKNSQPGNMGIVHPEGMFVNNLILPFFVALLIAGLIKEKTVIGRLFATRAMGLLGRSSYVFYLLHTGVFVEFIQKNISHRVYAIFLIVNLASIALYLFFEKPLNLLIRRKKNAGKGLVTGMKSNTAPSIP